MHDESKFFSIITVCYQAKNQIRKTIESVLQQTCCDYEYIIVDGKSPDSTFEIACSYKGALEKKGIRCQFISEKDTGIYNAMNKGVGLSHGKWLLFLNAGDYLCSENTLDMVKKHSFSEPKDFIYGDTIFEREGMYCYTACEELHIFDKLEYRMPFSHQSIFMAKHIFDVHMYDESYKMCADHELFLKCYREKRRWGYIPMPISVFVMDGFSSLSEHQELLKKEVLQISYKQGVISYRKKVLTLIGIKLRKNISWIIKKFVPAAVLEKRKQRILAAKVQADAATGWSKEFPKIPYDKEG